MPADKEQEMCSIAPGGGKRMQPPKQKSNMGAVVEVAPQVVHTPSVADRKAIKIITAKKGFSKYISPQTELAIGIFVLLMIISPAIFFSVALSVQYYTITPSSCQYNETWIGIQGDPGNFGQNPNPIPPVVFYRENTQSNTPIMDLSTQLDWLLGSWEVFLGKGVCPNGKKSEWDKKVNFCLPYEDAGIPDKHIGSVWKMIDVENSRQAVSGAVKPAVYSDFTISANNFTRAFGLSVIGCIASWILILYTIRDAIQTDFQDGDAGLDVAEKEQEESDENFRITFSEFSEENPNGGSVDHEKIAKDLISEHFDSHSLHKLNIHALHAMHESEEKKKTVTYTTAITIELIVFLILFSFAAYVYRLLSTSDFVALEGAWKGFFPYCDVTVTAGAGPGILLYQCVSMGFYAFSLMACEAYYAVEYLAQCMHHVMTHPDEARMIELHKEKEGMPNKAVTWTGPVFMSRIHLTKVRAIQQIWEFVVGPKHVVQKDSHMDAWIPPPNGRERSMHDVRAEQQTKAGAPKGQPAPPRKPAAKEFVL